MILFKILNLYY